MKKKLEEPTSSRTAKIVLLLFGLGPILFMGIFLGLNGFFSGP